MDQGVQQNNDLPQNTRTIENDPCYKLVATENTSMLIPTIQDVYIVYGTTPNYASIRDPNKGSWVIQAFVEVVRKHYRFIEFDGLIRRVQNRLKIIAKDRNVQIHQTISYEKRGVTKKFYIIPCLFKIQLYAKIVLCCCLSWLCLSYFMHALLHS